nr:PEP-CTERM sorting domain-containing protein [uncultured Desulfobacter sp.]
MFRSNVTTSLLFSCIAFLLSVSNLHALTLTPASFTVEGMTYSPTKSTYDEIVNSGYDPLADYFDVNYNNLLDSTHVSTYTAGINEKNDTGNLKPENNIGQAGDGLLNGEGGYFTNGAFIGYDSEGNTIGLDDEGNPYEGNALQDVYINDGNGPIDPGWIMLAETEINPTTADYQNLGADGPNIGTLLQITFDFSVNWTTGKWVLWTDPDKMAEVDDILEYGAFDNLALVIKTSDGWAVYDLNFNTIFREEIEAGNTNTFSFKTAHTLWGSFTDVDFVNDNNEVQDISHLSLWARDPNPLSAVPEPATLLLLGFGLLGIAGVSKRTSRNMNKN